MISALAKGSQVLDNGGLFLTAAVKAAEFAERELYDAGNVVLYRSWREGRAASEGFAEDYACFIQGLLDSYEASFDGRWLPVGVASADDDGRTLRRHGAWRLFQLRGGRGGHRGATQGGL